MNLGLSSELGKTSQNAESLLMLLRCGHHRTAPESLRSRLGISRFHFDSGGAPPLLVSVRAQICFGLGMVDSQPPTKLLRCEIDFDDSQSPAIAEDVLFRVELANTDVHFIPAPSGGRGGKR